MISIDCTGVEDVLDVTMAQQTELDYLIYNNPLCNPLLTLRPGRKGFVFHFGCPKIRMIPNFLESKGLGGTKPWLFESTRAHQTRKIRTCFRLEKGSDFSFSSGLRMKAPVDGAKLRYLVIDRNHTISVWRTR